MANAFVPCLAIFALFSAAIASDCPFPNGTATAFHWYDCNTQDPIQVQTITFTDANGNADYPVDPSKPLRLQLHSTNGGTTTYNADTVNVHLAEYVKGWTSNRCGWTNVPTFGMLNGLNGCQFANNCPLRPGPLDLTIQVDLSPYQSIIHLLAGHKAYQITVQMYNNNAGSHHEEIACVTTQLRFNIH